VSARQSLREIVDSLSEDEAADLLSRLQQGAGHPPGNGGSGGLSIFEIAHLPIEQRHAILRASEAESDIEELEAWEKGTGSDLDLIDA